MRSVSERLKYWRLRQQIIQREKTNSEREEQGRLAALVLARDEIRKLEMEMA
jgi:hypothetical protein